jgi:hypothetical protein
MNIKSHILTTLAVIVFPFMAISQNPDRRSVIQIAQEYVDAMYKADADKMEKCLHENFVKNGFYWKAGEKKFSDMTKVTRPQMIQIAHDWNKDSWVPEDAPREIELLDIQDKIAVIKVTAYWGIDYLHLSKNEEIWLIAQVLSQNWPKKEVSE